MIIYEDRLFIVTIIIFFFFLVAIFKIELRSFW